MKDWKNWTIVILIVVVLLLLGKLVVVQVDYNRLAMPDCKWSIIERDSIRVLVNEQRLKAGLEQTQDNIFLQQYAQFRADEIIQTGQYSHESKYASIWEWAESQGREIDFNVWYKYSEPGEAGGEVLMQGGLNACQTVDAWMQSPTHKDLLVRRRTDNIGIGINGSTVVIITGKERKPAPTEAESREYVRQQGL